MNYRNGTSTRPALRRRPFPSSGGFWALSAMWRQFYGDGTPERCQSEPTPPRRTMRRLRASLATTST